MTDMREEHKTVEKSENMDNADLLCQELTSEIRRLNSLSTRGTAALAMFLVVSILAWWGFPFLPTPATVTELLGKPPSARIISIVLLIYTFSAIALSLSRMTTGMESRSSFSHVGYLTAFFLFYYYGNSLEGNYWAVFGAGITILGVESYRIWSYCAENITKRREDIEYVTRTGKPPLQD